MKNIKTWLLLFCLILISADHAFADYTGKWEGTTSQDFMVSFSVYNDTVTEFTIKYSIEGINCTAEKESYFDTQTIVDNIFTYEGSEYNSMSGQYDYYSFSGTFIDGTTCQGTLYAEDSYCLGSVSGTWEANPLPAIAEVSPSAVSKDSLTIRDSFSAPDFFPEGLTYDGSNLWLASSSDHTIYKLDTTGTTLDSFDSPNSDPRGLAWDGANLWNGDSTADTIYRLDTSGNTISSFSSPGADPTGLAFDGTYLWNGDSTADTIYQLDTSGNTISSFSSPGADPTGLTFDGTYLWNADGSDCKIYRLDTSGNTIATYDSPGSSPKGLAFDGSFLWNVDSDFGNETIYQLEIPESVGVGTSKTWTLTLSNAGGEDLDVGALSITGTDASEFSISNDNCSGQSLSPFESATFDVVFTPTSSGEKNASITIPSDDAGSPLTVSLNWEACTLPEIVSFTGPKFVRRGESATLSWSISSASSASIDNDIGAVDPSGGSMEVTIEDTTTYELTASNQCGSVQATVTIRINAGMGGVYILILSDE